MKKNAKERFMNVAKNPEAGIDQLRAALSHHSEWKNELVSAEKLGRTTESLGFGHFSETDIVGLWKIGILRADYLESSETISIAGVIPLEPKSLYLDSRVMKHRPKGYGSTIPKRSQDESLKNDLQPTILFHPSRVYVLHHVARTFSTRTSACQYLLWKPGLKRIARHELEGLTNWSRACYAL